MGSPSGSSSILSPPSSPSSSVRSMNIRHVSGGGLKNAESGMKDIVKVGVICWSQL